MGCTPWTGFPFEPGLPVKGLAAPWAPVFQPLLSVTEESTSTVNLPHAKAPDLVKPGDFIIVKGSMEVERFESKHPSHAPKEQEANAAF